jgi:hypothetical protein
MHHQPLMMSSPTEINAGFAYKRYHYQTHLFRGGLGIYSTCPGIQAGWVLSTSMCIPYKGEKEAHQILLYRLLL